jgi:hypothetical protein
VEQQNERGSQEPQMVKPLYVTGIFALHALIPVDRAFLKQK